MVQYLYSSARSNRSGDPVSFAEKCYRCRPTSITPHIPNLGYAGNSHSRDRHSAKEPGRMHFCENYSYHLGRLTNADYAMPVWRRPRLRTMWLHRIHGTGRGWSLPRRGRNHCRTPFHSLRSSWQTIDESKAKALGKTTRSSLSFATQYPCTLTSDTKRKPSDTAGRTDVLGILENAKVDAIVKTAFNRSRDGKANDSSGA